MMLLSSSAHSVTFVYPPGGKIYQDFLKGFEDGWGSPVREVPVKEGDRSATNYEDSEGLIILGSTLWKSVSVHLKERRLSPIQVLACVMEVPAETPRPDWVVDLNVPAAQWGNPLLQIAPYVKSVGVIATKAALEKPPVVEAEKWLKGKKIRLVKIGVENQKEVVHQFRQNVRDIQALWLFPDPPILGRLEIVDFLLETSLRNGIIVIGPSSYYTQRGALLSAEPDYTSLGKETALAMKRRLKDPGAPPPSSNRFQLSFNRRTAYALGITLSKGLLNSASMVY